MCALPPVSFGEIIVEITNFLVHSLQKEVEVYDGNIPAGGDLQTEEPVLYSSGIPLLVVGKQHSSEGKTNSVHNDR